MPVLRVGAPCPEAWPAPQEFGQTLPGRGKDHAVLGAQDVAGMETPYEPCGAVGSVTCRGGGEIGEAIVRSGGVQGEDAPGTGKPVIRTAR